MAQTAAQGREYQGVSIPPAGTYELDRTHTVVGFMARHMLSKVRGQFTEFTGTIQVADSPEDSRVEVEVKTQSITTHTEKRDQHLKSGDFLEIEKHPMLRFTSTAVRPTGGLWFELGIELARERGVGPQQRAPGLQPTAARHLLLHEPVEELGDVGLRKYLHVHLS